MNLSRRNFLIGTSALALTAALPGVFSPAITKTIDAWWGGSLSSNTTYHVFMLPNGEVGVDTDPKARNLARNLDMPDLEIVERYSFEADAEMNILPAPTA